MANAFPAKYKERLIDPNRGGLSAVDVNTDTIKMGLVTSAYTPNLATHEFWSSASANVAGTPQTLTSVTVTDGFFNATSPVTFTAVAAGTAINYIIIYKDTGTTTTSPMLEIIDTATGSPGLPVTPNGGNITISLNASGLFSF